MTDLGVNCKHEVPAVIMNAIVKQNSIKRLELTFHRGTSINLMTKLIPTELDSNSSSNGNSDKNTGLEHICFNNCDAITADLTKCLAVTRLRGIDFKDGDSIPLNDLKVFLKNLEKLKTIECLMFKSVYCYDERTEREWLIDSEHTMVRSFFD